MSDDAVKLAQAALTADAEYERSGYADNALVMMHRKPTRILATALLAADQRMREMAAVVEAAKAWRATYEKPRDAMNWDAENAWTRVRLGDAIDAMTAARGAGRERP
jgi:hypothetical protein